MKIVVVCARKGGVGKTTLLAHLAIAALLARCRVACIDLDPQGSLTLWHSHRQRVIGTGPRLVDVTLATLSRRIDDLRTDGTRLVLVDTPPNVEAPVVAAAHLADLVIVPTRASSLDLQALPTTIALVRRAAAPALHVVLNAVRARDPDVEDARRYLERQLAVSVAPHTIADRAVMRRSMTDGRTALDIDPSGKAAAEVMDLWRWMQRLHTRSADAA